MLLLPFFRVAISCVFVLFEGNFHLLSIFKSFTFMLLLCFRVAKACGFVLFEGSFDLSII